MTGQSSTMLFVRVRDREDLRSPVSELVAIAMEHRWHVGFAATPAADLCFYEAPPGYCE